jgi:Kef-type K+ transport system membrane component KefB
MRTILVYLAMLATAAAAFYVISVAGADLSAPEAIAEAARGESEPAAHSNVLLNVLLTLTAVIALGCLFSKLLRSLGQPPVIGEVLAGIVLGPSVLGRLWPDATAILMPASAAPHVGVIGQLGVILYMFLIGLEFDTALVRARAKATVMIAHVSMVVPFVLGAAVALPLYPRLSSSDVPFTSFALFLGVAMSITAFPVLARILSDRNMQATPLGALALAAAALGDATAWGVLAFVVGIVQAQVAGAFQLIGLTLAFGAVMLVIVRPWATRWANNAEPTRGALALVFIGVLLSAFTTEAIGIHALFGAFLFGAILPHDSRLAREINSRLERPVTMLLLPAFFAFTGMRTEIGLVSGWEEWLLCGLIIGVATVGKFGGAFFAARACGLPWRDAGALGVLMNTRGLMELIVLNIGLELKVIGPTLYAMMVLMALATTIATTPILQWMRAITEPDPVMAPEASGPG